MKTWFMLRPNWMIFCCDLHNKSQQMPPQPILIIRLNHTTNHNNQTAYSRRKKSISCNILQQIKTSLKIEVLIINKLCYC